jgi:N-acylneuraminate cytidylyltransferase
MTINNKTVLAIIPARAGSKRVPDKNISLYNNKTTGEINTLIEWAILHAIGSKYIDTIIVSSDSDAILNYAKSAKSVSAIIPLRRPAYLSTDHASSEAVIVHALYTQPTHPDFYSSPPLHDFFVLLQPTSPNRTSQDIDSCIEKAETSTYGRCLSVNSESTPPGLRNGAVYVAKTERFLETLNLDAAEKYPMPASRSLDIDNLEDFEK